MSVLISCLNKLNPCGFSLRPLILNKKSQVSKVSCRTTYGPQYPVPVAPLDLRAAEYIVTKVKISKMFPRVAQLSQIITRRFSTGVTRRSIHHEGEGLPGSVSIKTILKDMEIVLLVS